MVIGLPISVGAAKCLPHYPFNIFLCSQHHCFLADLPTTWGDVIFYFQTMLYTTNQQEFCMIIGQLEDFPPSPTPTFKNYCNFEKMCQNCTH
jgi:hypothetical protein